MKALVPPARVIRMPTPPGTRSPRSSRAGRWSARKLVARAFTVYFHLVNLAEELQRIRTLRERDTGRRAGARVARRGRRSRISREQGPGGSTSCSHGLEIHPVFTAHPTEARRRAVVTALRRITGLL